MSSSPTFPPPNKSVLADTTANPAPLGLAAFGLTTFLLNAHNAGFFALDSMILGMGLFYGGLAQVFAGWMEWKKGATFGATAFTSYGAFWLALCANLILPKLIPGITAATPTSMAFFLGIWGVLTGVLFIGTFRLTRALRAVFGLLFVLFALLTLANATHGTGFSQTVHKLAGWEGMLTAVVAMYTGLAQVLNEVYGRIVWPVDKATPTPAPIPFQKVA